MSKMADVRQGIWCDPWFAGLDVDPKLLYLWAITNDHGNLAGLYVVAEPLVLAETRLTAKRLEDALFALGGKVLYRRDCGALWVVGRVNHVRSRTTQIAKSIANALVACPAPDLRAAFLEKYGDLGWLSGVLAETALESGKAEPQLNLTRTSPEVPSPSPSQDGTDNDNDNGKSRSRSVARDELPADLAEHLHPAALAALEALRRIAEAKGSVTPTLAAVGRAMATYPDRDHGYVVGDLEHWLLHGTGQNREVRDVVAFFRNQLKRAPAVTRRRLHAVEGGKSKYAGVVENA